MLIGKQREKKVVIDLSTNPTNASSSKITKRKEALSDSKNLKDTKKRRVEQENDPPVDDEKRQLMQIEIEERKMALQERATANRKIQAEIEKLELENKMLKKRLESEN